ncbi:hypothetical protein D3C84_1123600 [compost metagenome]
MQSRPASGVGERRAVKEAMTPPWEKPARMMRSGAKPSAIRSFSNPWMRVADSRTWDSTARSAGLSKLLMSYQPRIL